jgi:hypothetical protein
MTATEVERGRWYPAPPPALDGENVNAHTDRLTGAGRTGRSPYDHRRNRQCSIGWHSECTDPAGETCQCPHHTDEMPGDGNVPIPAAVDDAAVALAGCYDLPEATAVRIMLIAFGSDIGGVAGGGAEALRSRLEDVYRSRITDGFLTDVVNISVASAAGSLRKTQS